MADLPKPPPESILLPTLVIVGLLIYAFYKWAVTGGPDTKPGLFLNTTPAETGIVLPGANNSGTNGSNLSAGAVPATRPVNATTSIYAGLIHLYRGNAGTNQSNLNQEYVELDADYNLKDDIDITGWKLMNGRGNKNFDISGRLVQGTSQTLSIPQGATLFNGSAPSALGDIWLGPGERAYLVTGNFPFTSPFPVNTSFKTNKCVGYMENYLNWSFYPYLSSNCPQPSAEAGVSALDDKCNQFVRGFGSCHVPTYTDYDPYTSQTNLVDHQSITSVCHNYITTHFGYDQCLKYHSGDADFAGKEWRIFLGYRGIGFWQTDRETMYLLDKQGKIVDTVTYGF
jgi:hypothetical protein